jgi:hypothetical protein
MFDFTKFHYRSINAADDAERAAINQDLKDLYATLPDEQKKVFNEELQTFLMSQYKKLGTDYEAIKESGALN